MTKPKEQPLKLVSNSLELSTLKNSTLSIQLSLDGFSFCIYDTIKEGLVTLQHFPFKVNSPVELLEQIKIILEKSEWLNRDFKRLNVCHENILSTLVPKSLFDKNKLADYLSYSVKTLENDYYDYDNLKTLDTANVYIPFVNVNNFFIDKFGSFTFNHFSSLLIKQLLSDTQNSDEPQVFAHITKTHFEIIVIKAQKLLLYNSFVYKTKEDFIYYILFVAEQLQLNTNTFKLNLLGNITTQDSLFSIAYTYVKHVSLYKYDFRYKALFPLTELQKRRFFTLLQQI